MKTTARGRPVVFISHDAADRRAAAAVSDALAEAAYAPWSLNDAYPGENVLLKAGRALDRAEAIVVLLSPASFASRVHRFVLEFAISGDRFDGRLIPVVLPDTDDFPWFLERLQPIRVGQRLKVAARKVVARVQHAVG
jgi:hypothetical protein